MNIQSIITMNKEITIDIVNDLGLNETLYLAFISVHINRDNGQCPR